MKLKAFTGWYWEGLCLLVYLAITVNQLFLPPIIGLADNGDFPKALAPYNVCDPNHERDVFAYVFPRYVIRPDCHWDSRLPSSEGLVVRVNKLFARWTGRDSFRITGAGKAHLLVVLIGLGILLWALHEASPAVRYGLPPLVILIFSDVAYVAYMNSFFMDAASMVFMLLTVAAAAAWVLRPRTWVIVAFGIGGVLLGLSKTQHAITVFFLAGLAAWFAVREFRRRKLHFWLWSASAAAVALATVATLAMTPKDYKAEPLYSLVFYRLLPGFPNPGETLKELGLPESDLQYSGTHAYFAGAPVMNPEWREQFIHQVTYAELGAYYLRHPSVFFRLVGKGLTEEASAIRPGNIGNYEKEDGFPPHALTQRFALWSHLRSWLLAVFPAHLVIFYCVMGIASLLCLFRTAWAAQWPAYPLVLLLTVSGVVEFLFPVLLDATETARHLFFFHVVTEILIVCAFGGVLSLLGRRLRRTA